MSRSRRSGFGSDDWLLEQEMRAQMEAQEWRRLRAELAMAQLAVAEMAPVQTYRPEGSATLKGLVRFGLGAFGAYLGYLSAIDSRLAGLEVWLAAGAGFLIVLSLSMLGPARSFVHMLAEAVRWTLIVALTIGALWLLVGATT